MYNMSLLSPSVKYSMKMKYCVLQVSTVRAKRSLWVLEWRLLWHIVCKICSHSCLMEKHNYLRDISPAMILSMLWLQYRPSNVFCQNVVEYLLFYRTFIGTFKILGKSREILFKSSKTKKSLMWWIMCPFTFLQHSLLALFDNIQF